MMPSIRPLFFRDSGATIVAFEPKFRDRIFLAAAGILVVGSLAWPAAADEFDALNVVTGGSVTHDSNLFRESDSASPQSDTIKAGYLGLRINKPYAQQRFQVDVTETATRYDKSSNLDFNALSYRGAWQWHLSPRISGTLSADRAVSLVPFEESLGKQRDVRVTQNRLFNLDAWIFGGWHTLLGVSQSKQTSEQAFQTVPDFRSVSEEIGVKYIAPTGSWVSATRRSIQGHYLNAALSPVSNDFDSYRQDETELRANWILDGRSTVTSRLAWIERHNETFTRGNFSGLAGELGYNRILTSKLRLDCLAKRDISPYQTLSSAYAVNNVLSLAPSWQASAKIAVHLRLEHIKSHFRGGVAVPNVPTRSDTKQTAFLGADWTLLRGVSVGASLLRQRRTSTVAFFEYDDTIAGVNASLIF